MPNACQSSINHTIFEKAIKITTLDKSKLNRIFKGFMGVNDHILSRRTLELSIGFLVVCIGG